MGIHIRWPQSGNAAAVVLNGTGPDGITCASGTIDDAGRGGSITIKVHVYFPAVSVLDPSPPMGSIPYTFSGSNWTVPNVSVPAGGFGPGPYPAITVGAWEPDLASGGWQVPDGVQTCGMLANQVDCSGTGPHVPCGTGPGIQLASAARRAVGATAVALAPAVWSVTLGGFFASLGTGLAGAWFLELRDGLGGIWDNGGDGLARPRVELSCDGPPLPRWRLRLRHGPLALEYTAPAAWEALGSLTLAADLPEPYPRTLTAQPV